MLPARQSYFLCLYLSNTASPGISLDAGEVLPARQPYFFLSLPVQQSKSWYLVGRWRGAPGQTNALPSARTKKYRNPVERDIPGRFGKLSLQSTTGEVPPPSSQVSISPQMPQEPPGWTTSPFPPSSAKLAHQTGGHAHQLDVG